MYKSIHFNKKKINAQLIITKIEESQINRYKIYIYSCCKATMILYNYITKYIN